MSSKAWTWALGLIYIFAVATIWIAASFVVQSVVDAGVSPFLITYICNSLLVIYIPIFEIGRYLEDRYGSLLFWRNKRSSHLRELVESEEAILLGLGDLGVRSDAFDGSISATEDLDGPESGLENIETERESSIDCIDEVNENCNKGLDEKGRWTRTRLAKVSLLICPFWFLALLSFNLSLKYTTVTVSALDLFIFLLVVIYFMFQVPRFSIHIDLLPVTAVKYHLKQCIEPFHVSGVSGILGREVHMVETLRCCSVHVWNDNCQPRRFRV